MYPSISPGYPAATTQAYQNGSTQVGGTLRKYRPVWVHDARSLIENDRYNERGSDNSHVGCAQIIPVGYAKYPRE